MNAKDWNLSTCTSFEPALMINISKVMLLTEPPDSASDLSEYEERVAHGRMLGLFMPTLIEK